MANRLSDEELREMAHGIVYDTTAPQGWTAEYRAFEALKQVRDQTERRKDEEIAEIRTKWCGIKVETEQRVRWEILNWVEAHRRDDNFWRQLEELRRAAASEPKEVKQVSS